MTLLQAIVLAVLQGVTEPFPVSSLGHAVLLPHLLGWNVDERSPFFLPFLTMLHLGTLAALAGVFWRDWTAIFRGVVGLDGPRTQAEAVRILVLLVLATIPAVIVGGALEHRLRALFGAPLAVAGFLVLNGLLLIATEWLRRRREREKPAPDEHRPIASLTAADALVIGLWQCLALLPGLSRSGATINGGLLRGLDHETAARFSLLMAQPVVFAATVREAWQLRHISPDHAMIVDGITGAVVAGIAALICSLLLLRFLRDHDRWALTPFGLYCIAAGAACAALIAA